MKTSPDEDPHTEISWKPALGIPNQNCRRRSLPRLPELKLNTSLMSSNKESIPKSPNGEAATHKSSHHTNMHYWERRASHSHLGDIASHHNHSNVTMDRQTQHQQAPCRPPRPSLQFQFKSPEFADQFDAYLYQSQHIAMTIQAPEVMLEFPSEESSRRPSRCSVKSGSSSVSPYSPHNQLPPDLLCPSPFSNKLLFRRASHAGNLGQADRQQQVYLPPTQPFLNVPRSRSRSRGSSLPDNISSSELYRLRNFATSGKRVINKGDSYRSRNNSINSSRSR